MWWLVGLRRMMGMRGLMGLTGLMWLTVEWMNGYPLDWYDH